MENKKNINEDIQSKENTYNELLSIYNRHFGEHKSQKSEDNPSHKESDMDEGKLFTKFILKK